jgi:phage terminase small subunit
VKEWDRLAPILTKAGLLTEAGVSALATLCALHGKLVQLWQAGEAPNASMVGSYRNLINDFGLTPVAQGKVKPVGAKDEGNAFDKNKRERAA